ncbi:phosphoacetylglucosamine mutase [Fagus crenata]
MPRYSGDHQNLARSLGPEENIYGTPCYFGDHWKSGSEKQKAALRLLAVSKLINQAVGDALSGLLLVEAILRWDGQYTDVLSFIKIYPVKVVDRTAVVTANAETVAVSPPGIQEAINAETESSTQEAADSLANSVAKLVDVVPRV